jgi:hypothetical protein
MAMKPRAMTKKRGGGTTAKAKKKTKMAMGGMTSGTMRPQNAMAGASVPASQKTKTGMKRGGTAQKTKMMRGGTTKKNTMMRGGGMTKKK